jgi:hypothetical protein
LLIRTWFEGVGSDESTFEWGNALVKAYLSINPEASIVSWPSAFE